MGLVRKLRGWRCRVDVYGVVTSFAFLAIGRPRTVGKSLDAAPPGINPYHLYVEVLCREDWERSRIEEFDFATAEVIVGANYLQRADGLRLEEDGRSLLA